MYLMSTMKNCLNFYIQALNEALYTPKVFLPQFYFDITNVFFSLIGKRPHYHQSPSISCASRYRIAVNELQPAGFMFMYLSLSR